MISRSSRPHDAMLKSTIHKLKTGKFQLSYVNPLNKKRVRNTFKTKSEAIGHINVLTTQYVNRNLSSFTNLTIGNLIEAHMRQVLDTKLNCNPKVLREFKKEFKHLKLSELNTPLLSYWFTQMKIKNDYSNKTLVKMKYQLDHLFKWLVLEELIPYSPLKQITYSERVPPKRKRVYLSKEEIKIILLQLKNWNPTDTNVSYFYQFIYILIHTAGRQSEVLNLEWKDIDFKLDTITFRDTKVNDDRILNLSKPLKEYLETLQRSTKYVIHRDDDKLIPPSTLGRHVEMFRKRFPNGKNWGCHSLRHSFAYHYLRDGGDMYQLQAILGHYKITTTVDTYSRITAKDVENPSPYEF